MKSPSNKIFVITELYYPEETSTGYFLTKIAEGLAQKFVVTVVCAQPTYSSRGIKAPWHERRNGVEIYRCWSTTFDKNSLIKKTINSVIISISLFIKLLLILSPKSNVLVVTNPPILPYLTAVSCWIKRAKFALLVHDVYPEVLIATNIISPKGFVAKLGDWLSKLLYLYSSLIIVLGRDMKSLILSKLSDKDSHKVKIITNWADIDEIQLGSRRQNYLLNSLKVHEKFIVQFSGNMGRTHGIETVVEAAKLLNNDPDIHFLFCGSGAKKAWLQSHITNEKQTNISLLPHQPRGELSELLNASDVSIISFMPGMAGISVPSRMYNILAAGKPIIAVADSYTELALVILEEGIGWVVPPNQPLKLAEAIIYAKQHATELVEMGLKAREVAERKYSLNKIITVYQQLFSL